MPPPLPLLRRTAGRRVVKPSPGAPCSPLLERGVQLHLLQHTHLACLAGRVSGARPEAGPRRKLAAALRCRAHTQAALNPKTSHTGGLPRLLRPPSALRHAAPASRLAPRVPLHAKCVPNANAGVVHGGGPGKQLGGVSPSRQLGLGRDGGRPPISSRVNGTDRQRAGACDVRVVFRAPTADGRADAAVLRAGHGDWHGRGSPGGHVCWCALPALSVSV